MTQTISAAMDEHYAQDTTTLCKVWKATRKDATVFGMTDHDRDLTVAGVTYRALSGLDASAVQHTIGLAVNNASLIGAFMSDAVTEADLIAGLWDYCLIQSWEVNWADTTQTRWLLSGRLGRVSSGRHAFEAELLSRLQNFQQDIGRVVGPLCDAELGDTRCKVRLNPSEWSALAVVTVRTASDANTGSVVKSATAPTRHFKCTTAGTTGGSVPAWDTTIGNTTADGSAVWTALRALTFTGTITSVTSNRVFADSALTDPPDDWFTGGEITFTSGLNNGLSREVKLHVQSGGSITLQQAFPFAVAVSDAYSITAGCQLRRVTDCKTKFDNVYNHRGFDLLPGMDKIQSGGLNLV